MHRSPSRRSSAAVAAVVVVVGLLLAIGGCQTGGNGADADAAEVGSAGDAQREIGALLDQYTQALLNKDVAALDRIWANDLTFVNPRGELLGKADRMANIKTGATAFKSIRLSEQRIRPHGQTALATFRVALDAQYGGQEGSGDYRVTTAWARSNGPWRMTAVHMTRIAQ